MNILIRVRTIIHLKASFAVGLEGDAEVNVWKPVWKLPKHVQSAEK